MIDLLKKCFVLSLYLELLFFGFTLHAESKNISLILEADKKSDFLAMRVLIKKTFKEGLSVDDWKAIRKILQNRPQLGYDLIYKWDQIPVKNRMLTDKDKVINDLLEIADEQMESELFEGAFTNYQKVAKTIKSELTRGNKDNTLVYSSTIHSMARALYGAGRFKESLEVYTWIDRKYPRYRRVLFEKMWAAFRSGRIDIAMGAIGSQSSSYFSEFLEPESYLVQIYIYKILCREEEIKQIRKLLQNFKSKLTSKSKLYPFEEWAESDIETLSLLRLSKSSINPDIYGGGIVTPSIKRDEKKLISKALESKFQLDKERMISYLDKAKAYSSLAVAADRGAFYVEKIPDRSRLLSEGKEIWTISDAENWLDEVGYDLYIGESLCQKK